MNRGLEVAVTTRPLIVRRLVRPGLRVPGSVLLVVLAAGCDPGRPAAVPAGGKVTYKKTQVPAGALVVFHPADPAFEKRVGGKPAAKVGDDGSFRLTTYEAGDGAPPGEYGVTVDWQRKGRAGGLSLGGEGGGGGPSVLNPRYSDPRRPFAAVTVTPGGPNEFTFDVD
jgi:hypothetical protein